MKTLALSLAAVLTAGVAAAGEVAPLDVKYDEYGAVEQSLSGQPGDPENGAKIMVIRGKGNCIACHQTTVLNHAPFHGEVGPSLDGVGDRWSEAELRGIVANAKMAFEGTVMPSFYKVNGYIRPGDGFTGKAAKTELLPPLLTAQEIEDVVAFLMTIKE